MADKTKVAKVALASAVTYARSLPRESFNCNFGLKFTLTPETSILFSELKSTSEQIGEFCDLGNFSSRSFESLLSHFTTQGTSRLKEAFKYKCLIIELTHKEFKTLKYFLPSIMNKSSQAIFVISDLKAAEQAGTRKQAEIQIRDLIYDLVWCLNSSTTSCDPLMAFKDGNTYMLSTTMSNSKFQRLSNYANRGYMTRSELGSDAEYLKNIPNFKEETSDLKKGEKPAMKDLKNFTLEEAFGADLNKQLIKQTWAGSITDIPHFDKVSALLQSLYPDDSWDKLSPSSFSLERQAKLPAPLINLPKFK